jgi:ubiquinone/menaquinone biosynthesis C-methylase UbiE
MALRDHVAEAFAAAAPEHFAWQTEGHFIARQEGELVRRAFLPLGKRVLDVGCGEGATFARERFPACLFVASSCESMPFDAGTFDHVIVRDVVHHLDEPERLVDECRRVLGPGGRIDVLEPCRYNPLIVLHALAKPAERGELRSTLPFLVRLLSRRFTVVATARYQAMPIHRVILHPDIGRPGLAEDPRVCTVLAGIERLAEAIVPDVFWAYIHVRAVVS